MSERTLVAGVGYCHASDLSVGPFLADRFTREAWSDGVDVDDLSYGPIAVAQTLEDAKPAYARIVFVAAVDRGLSPGIVRSYKWDGVLPEPGEIQARVGQAITGIVDLDNLLVVVRQFGALPPAVFVVEVQPENQEFGTTFSETIESQLNEIARLARTLAEDPAASARCPVAPLGGPAVLRPSRTAPMASLN